MFRLGRCAGELECVVSHGSCRKCRTAHHGRSVPVSAPAQTHAADILYILQYCRSRAGQLWHGDKLDSYKVTLSVHIKI